MKILVPLKSILNPSGLTVNRKAGKVFVNREEFKMNPASKCALETALRLKEAGGADVIAVAWGSAQADDCLREARAMGATQAFLLDCGNIDSHGVVTSLLALINHLGGVDLIVNGHRTLDTGQTSGAWLAEALGWPYLAEAVECSVDKEVVRIVRRSDDERCPFEAFETDLPAVVTVTRDGPQPRYPHGGDLIIAYRNPKAYETLAASDLGLSDSDLQPVTAERGQSFPPEREFGKQVTVADIAEMIR
jgi:electron transfer flavoprotein beta subunit